MTSSEAVGDGDGGLVRSSAVGDLAVLGAEVAVLGACRGPGRLDEGAPQPAVAVGGADPATLAGRLVVARAQTRPTRPGGRGWGTGSCRRRSRR